MKIHSTNRQIAMLCAAAAVETLALCWADQHRSSLASAEGAAARIRDTGAASPRPCHTQWISSRSYPRSTDAPRIATLPSPRRDTRISSLNVEPEDSRESDSAHRSSWFARWRQRVGSLLIWAGARLIGDQRTAFELAQSGPDGAPG